jgi:hypothetical protein
MTWIKAITQFQLHNFNKIKFSKNHWIRSSITYKNRKNLKEKKYKQKLHERKKYEYKKPMRKNRNLSFLLILCLI